MAALVMDNTTTHPARNQWGPLTLPLPSRGCSPLGGTYQPLGQWSYGKEGLTSPTWASHFHFPWALPVMWPAPAWKDQNDPAMSHGLGIMQRSVSPQFLPEVQAATWWPLQLVRDSAPAAREKSHHSSCPSNSFHGAHGVSLLPALPVGSRSVLLCRSNSLHDTSAKPCQGWQKGRVGWGQAWGVFNAQ